MLVILGVAALWFVPEVELFGMQLARVDIFSQLRQSVDDEVVEYEADIERLEQELASMVEVDSVILVDTLPVLPPARYEWLIEREAGPSRRALHSSDLESVANRLSVAIEDFDTLEHSRLDALVERMALGQGLRIAFMGDSFVEGDILTSDLRAELQELFGGRGVGFVACDIPFATVRKSVKRSSSGWSAYSVMKPKSAPQDVADKFFVSGYLAKGGAGATTRWSATNAFETLDSCSRARVLLYSKDTSLVRVAINDSIVNEVEIAGDERVREIYVEAPLVEAVTLTVLDGEVLCYGASMEGDGGVVVDNFSVRSNNGHAIFGTGATVNRQIDEFLGYDLVVLQYGLNIMQQGQRKYSNYRQQLCNMIAYAERCFPNAVILVLGVSDRWVKGESGGYVPIGSVDALTAHQRAAADSTNVAFWNTSLAMEALGGMPQFVSNGWAANDYTHINFAGGKRIARALASAIVAPVYEVLKAKEAEEQRRKEAEERLRAEVQQRFELQSQRGIEITIEQDIIHTEVAQAESDVVAEEE